DRDKGVRSPTDVLRRIWWLAPASTDHPGDQRHVSPHRRSFLGTKEMGSFVKGFTLSTARPGSGSNMRSQIFPPSSHSRNQLWRLGCVDANACGMGSPTPRTFGSKVTTAPSGVEQSTQDRMAQPQSQKGTR